MKAMYLAAMYLAATIVLAAGCNKSSDDHKTEPADRYTVRGQVTGLSSAEHPNEVEIDTERIPAFKSIDGKVSAMMPMPMSYAVDGVPMAGIAQGDPVEISFEVHWKDMPPLRLTRIAKLPAGTKLALDR